MDNTLYITGAGVSAESGIPTFRGEDGYWTIGSQNYTPQQMATRAMYRVRPGQFLLWYFKRFATYRHYGPNAVHTWLSDKNLITQNIDGLDGKAGNQDYIPIHGRLDKVTLFHDQEIFIQEETLGAGERITLMPAPWAELSDFEEDDETLEQDLLTLFRIDPELGQPELYRSYKPFVLLFDEYYTDLYRMSEAEARMRATDRMVFIGTSFSVNITQIALKHAIARDIPVEVVDPNPVTLPYSKVTYHPMKASEYVRQADQPSLT